MAKRLIVLLLYVPMLMVSVFIWIPFYYLMTGRLANELPVDWIVRWAK